MDEIIYYISNKLNNPTAALNLANDFIEEANNILEFPYGNSEYKPIKKLKNKYRKSKVKNYNIFYTIDEENKTIIIARVLHQKMNTNNILE